MAFIRKYIFSVIFAFATTVVLSEVTVSVGSDTGDVSESVFLDISLGNEGSVGGLQFDILDTPNYLDVVGFATTARSDGFSVDFSVLEGGVTRVLMYHPQNEDIESGSGSVVNMEMVVHDDAYNSNVSIDLLNLTVTDGTGSSYVISAADSGTVTVSPGYIETPHNLQSQDGMDAEVALYWSPPTGPAYTYLDETLDEGLPGDWEVIDGGNVGNTWEWIQSYGGSSLDGTPFVYIDADAAGQNSQFDDQLVSPSFPLSGEIYLSFDHFYNDYTGDYVPSIANVDVWDGAQWVNVYQASENGVTIGAWDAPDQQLLDVSSYGNGQFKVRFHYQTDPSSWEWYWAIDNIRLANFLEEGRYSTIYELNDRGWSVINHGSRDEMEEAFQSGDWPYAYSNPETFEIVDNSLSIQNQNSRPVDLDAYKIYRSVNDESSFTELAEVGGNTTNYVDENVLNSTTYYYYVTAIYPDGSESGPTNTVSATPVEWVELWFDDGASLSGQTDTLDFYINNDSELGFFYFDILDVPNVLNALSVLPTERTAGWQFNDPVNSDGTMEISVGSNNGNPLTAGNGPVCRVVVYPVTDQEMSVNLSYTSRTEVMDVGFVDLNWTSESSTYDVGIETQYLHLYGGYGEAGGQTVGSLFLNNTQPVYAMQFDILANPQLIVGTEVVFSDLLELDDWNISGLDLGVSYRITASTTQANPIPPGVGHLADVIYNIYDGIPDSTIVDIDVNDPILADMNNLPMYTEVSPGSFYIGQPPVGCTIENVSGYLVPGGTGSFEVHMENTEMVNILELEIVDMPDYMKFTNITYLDRFEDVISDDAVAEETETGSFYFFGYDVITGIEPGSGPIMRIEVEFNDVIDNPSIVFMIDEVSAGDELALPLTAISGNFGQFITGVVVSTDNTVGLPGSFALYPNYPNPFNPSTVISYDIAQNTHVTLDIYDMRGRVVKNLVRKIQDSGRYTVNWYGNDNAGSQVGAGVYIYKLSAGDNVFNRKMILMK